MTTFDLEKLWQDSDHQAESHYDQISDEVEQKAKDKSGSLLQKIRYNMRAELYVAVLMLAGFSFYFWGNPVGFVFFLLFSGIVLGFSWNLYRRMDKAIGGIAAENVVDSLTDQIAVLRSYVARMKWFIYFAVPIGYIFGFLLRFLKTSGFEELFTAKMLYGLVISIVLQVIFVWFANTKYIYWLYEKHVDDMQEVLDSLKREG